MRYLILTVVAMSSTPCMALKPSAFYVVHDGIISPGLLALHIEALNAFKQESIQVGFRGPHHGCDFDDGHYMAIKPQQATHTEAAPKQIWQATEAKLSPRLSHGNAKIDPQTAVDQELMKLVYLPTASMDQTVDAYSKHITWLQLNVLGGQGDVLQSALSAWTKQLKAQGSPLQFSVYQKSFGGHLSQFILIFHHVIQTKPDQLLPTIVLDNISGFDVSQGIHQPAASYGC